MKTATLTQSPSYSKNIEKCESGEGFRCPCAVCGRHIKDAKYWLTFVGGSLETVAMYRDADPDDAGYMGCYPIGPDCLRNNPQARPFLVDMKDIN